MYRMTPHDTALLLWQLALGFSLSATCGLRAFLPLFAASAAAHFGQVTLGPSFAWMGSTPALIIFGSAVVFEVLADKVPALDHALDAAGVFVKPAAATLLAASFFTGLDPVVASVLGLVSGGAVATTVHVVKAKTRLASSVFTLGTGNPFLSLAEDVLAVCGVILSIVLPIVAAFVIATLIALVAFLLIRRYSRPVVPVLTHRSGLAT